jgi:phosphinothricin acetyltransferase
MLSIRLATIADLAAINDIYNHYVPLTTTSYDTAPSTLEDRRKWFAGREPIHPVTVALLDDAPAPSPPASSLQSPASPVVVGWGSLHTWRSKSGYRTTVENSVYVHPDHLRIGVGSAILADQITRARELGLHVIVAGIDSEQLPSLALHYKHGFREVGRFPQVGRKFDRWLEAIFMQLTLE